MYIINIVFIIGYCLGQNKLCSNNQRHISTMSSLCMNQNIFLDKLKMDKADEEEGKKKKNNINASDGCIKYEGTLSRR